MTGSIAGDARPVLAATDAQLFVADIGAACDFYVNRLGFRVEFSYGEPPYYGLVKRDNARLALRLVCEPVFVGDIREREQLLSASITLCTADAIHRLFAEYQAAGVSFQQPLQTQPWGAQNFIVRDPDNNLVLFAGPAG